ncbi:MAG: hypothetical protein JO004_10860 [Methylobacteriaceae bacterium]|nr:hypothetical protein [Methylobacteriaceae bacterium]
MTEQPKLTGEAREIVSDLVRAAQAVLDNWGSGGNPRNALVDLETILTDARALLED